MIYREVIEGVEVVVTITNKYRESMTYFRFKILNNYYYSRSWKKTTLITIPSEFMSKHNLIFKPSEVVKDRYNAITSFKQVLSAEECNYFWRLNRDTKIESILDV